MPVCVCVCVFLDVIAVAFIYTYIRFVSLFDDYIFRHNFNYFIPRIIINFVSRVLIISL